MIQVILFAFLWEAVKTSNVEGKVEGCCDVIEFGHVSNVKIGFDVLAFELCFCHADGTRCKINAGNLPACTCQCDDVRAGATAEIDSFARGVGLDELDEFGRGDAAIPGRFAEVPEVEGQFAEHVGWVRS